MQESNKSIKITALAITLNEEKNVKKYIESLSFADEIIFIDSHSIDKTTLICQEMRVKVIQRKFDNFSNQRNFAIQQAKNDWVIFFDLDEIISKKIVDEIIETVNNSKGFVAFYVKRNFFLFNKHLKYGGFQNDNAIRLFNKNNCKYNGNLVHEEIQTDGKVGILKNSIDHHSYKNFEHYCTKLNLYSKLQATKLHDNKRRPNIYHFIIMPFYRFVWQYFYRLGILDGTEGFLSSCINSFFVFKRYLELWLLNKKIE
jgi:glycosyltransferase involved in cell wall biosynthesis